MQGALKEEMFGPSGLATTLQKLSDLRVYVNSNVFVSQRFIIISSPFQYMIRIGWIFQLRVETYSFGILSFVCGSLCRDHHRRMRNGIRYRAKELVFMYVTLGLACVSRHRNTDMYTHRNGLLYPPSYKSCE